jgi:hypothetical protein
MAALPHSNGVLAGIGSASAALPTRNVCWRFCQRSCRRLVVPRCNLSAQHNLDGRIHGMHLKNVLRVARPIVVRCMSADPLIVARCGDRYGISRCRESGRRSSHQV